VATAFAASRATRRTPNANVLHARKGWRNENPVRQTRLPHHAQAQTRPQVHREFPTHSPLPSLRNVAAGQGKEGMRNTIPPYPKATDRLSRPGTRPHAPHRPNRDAVKHGIPRAFRRYAKRYGSGVASLVAEHKKYPVPKLDHWRDSREAAQKLVAILSA
jgi:hypothetical protein